MKKNAFYFLLFLAGFLLQGCGSYSTIPFKGQYPPTPFVIKARGDYQQTWDRLLDIFAQNDFSIRIVDKQSGLIVLNRANLMSSYTTENAKGGLVRDGKYVVVTRCYNETQSDYIPVSEISADWNVRVKVEDGNVMVNVNMVNVVIRRVIKVGNNYVPICSDAIVKSTGLLESQITEGI